MNGVTLNISTDEATMEFPCDDFEIYALIRCARWFTVAPLPLLSKVCPMSQNCIHKNNYFISHICSSCLQWVQSKAIVFSKCVVKADLSVKNKFHLFYMHLLHKKIDKCLGEKLRVNIIWFWPVYKQQNSGASIWDVVKSEKRYLLEYVTQCKPGSCHVNPWNYLPNWKRNQIFDLI